MATDIENIIENNRWTFAKTYAKSHPHEYIVRSKCSSAKDFDFLCDFIKANGHYEYFFGKRGTYCSIGDFTYWIMGDIINRRWNDMYKLDARKFIYKVNNWEELLNDGRVLHK